MASQFQRIPLAHAQRWRYRKVLPGASFTRTGGGPGCGDVITIYARVESLDQASAHLRDALKSLSGLSRPRSGGE